MECENYLPKNLLHLNGEVTRACNLRCDYCFNNSGTRLSHELSKDQWKVVVNIASKYGVRSTLFTGGEVMLRKDAPEIIHYSLSNGLDTNILTNGYRLRENGKDFVGKLKRVQISLDSASPITHDSRRGVGSWRVARDAIDFAREYGTPVEISTTISPDRVDELEGIAGIAYATGSKMLVRHLIGIGRASNSHGFDDEAERRIARTNHNILSVFSNIFIEDFARYVPVLGEEHDAINLKEGYVTILPDGTIRGSDKNLLSLAA